MQLYYTFYSIALAASAMERIPLHSWEMEFSIQCHVTINSQLNYQNSIRYYIIWYGMVWYGMVWYGMVWYGMVWYGMVWYGMVWYGYLTNQSNLCYRVRLNICGILFGITLTCNM